MATFNINKKQLKTKDKDRSNKRIGEGFLNTFEIPVGGTPPVASQTAFRLFNSALKHSIGPNAQSGNWLTIISQSDSTQVFHSIKDDTAQLGNFPQSGRGSVIFNTSRVYYGLTLSGSFGITGSITAANIYFPISRSATTSNNVFGESFGIFAGGIGELDVAFDSYNTYFTSSKENKTLYSALQTPTENTVLTYSLNSTAISVLNDNNNFGGAADKVNFALIAGSDFNGTEPTFITALDFFSTSSTIDVIAPNYPSIAITDE